MNLLTGIFLGIAIGIAMCLSIIPAKSEEPGVRLPYYDCMVLKHMPPKAARKGETTA